MKSTRPRSELLKRWENMDRLVMPVEIKTKDEKARTFRGALSTSHLDLGDGRARDIVMPGAFKRWIGSFRSAADSYVPLIDSHDRWSIFNVFGHLDDAEERLTGKVLKYELEGGKTLEVKEMFLDTDWQVIDGPDGDRVLDRLRPGSIRKMSMGYDAKNWDNQTLAEGGLVRRLKELAISEGSLVVFPMNPAAEVDISTVKGFLEDLDGETLDDNDRAILMVLQKEIGALLTNGQATAEPAPEMLKALQERIQRLNLHRLATRIEAARHSGSKALKITD